eukprot:SAG22_NODE_18_length_32591_cov_38.043549_2_plen_143_part_00
MSDDDESYKELQEPYPTRVWRDYTNGSRQTKDPDQEAYNADIDFKYKDEPEKAWAHYKKIPKIPKHPVGKDCWSFAELENYVTKHGQRDVLNCNSYCLEIFQDWVVNPFLDLDDACDTEKDADIQTKLMIAWAKTTLPGLDL